MESNTTNYSITQFDGTYSNTNRILKAVNERINSERLSAKRQELGWTQEELAKQAGVSQSTINKMEKGHVATGKGGSLERIAKALGVEPSWLLTADEDVLESPGTPELQTALPELRNVPNYPQILAKAKALPSAKHIPEEVWKQVGLLRLDMHQWGKITPSFVADCADLLLKHL